MDFTKLYKFFEQEPLFRKRQMEKAVFSDALDDWDEATVLPKALREKLNRECPLAVNVEKMDLTGRTAQKALFDFSGDKVEAVLMRHPERNTVCVSSQAGCALGCRFCATGKLGFRRNLTHWEIIEQVLHFSRLLKKEEKRVTNVVFMGMGEPFLNYDAVIKAVKVLNDPEKFNIGARKISISTVGVVSGIKQLAKEDLQVNLAVSLHAPNDKLRSALMPINKKHSLKQLLEAIAYYIEKTKRRVMIEYVMLENVNDAEKDAKELAALLKSAIGHLFMVNLIRYNQTGEFKESDQEKIAKFKKALIDEKIEVIERYRFGETIKAACGQLAGNSR